MNRYCRRETVDLCERERHMRNDQRIVSWRIAVLMNTFWDSRWETHQFHLRTFCPLLLINSEGIFKRAKELQKKLTRGWKIHSLPKFFCIKYLKRFSPGWFWNHRKEWWCFQFYNFTTYFLLWPSSCLLSKIWSVFLKHLRWLANCVSPYSTIQLFLTHHIAALHLHIIFDTHTYGKYWYISGRFPS